MLVNIIRPVPPQALTFVKAHEGCKLTAYLDSVGVVTIGYGHTGPGLALGQTISPEQAEVYLAHDLATAAQRLETAVGEACVAELTNNQYSALLSFVLNVGCDSKWTICTDLRAKNFDAVPSQLMRFVNAGGKKLTGLVNRRADEVKLWSTDEPGSVPDSPPSSVTRAVDTPPTPVAVKPLGKSKTWWAGLSTAGLGVATPLVDHAQGALKTINATISPYVGQSEVLQHLQGSMTLALAGSAVLLVGLIWLKNHEAKSS